MTEFYFILFMLIAMLSSFARVTCIVRVMRVDQIERHIWRLITFLPCTLLYSIYLSFVRSLIYAKPLSMPAQCKFSTIAESLYARKTKIS